MNLRLASIAVGIALCIAGCAHRCDYGLTKCQYLCNRDYQVCQLHGNGEWYCQNEYRNCWVECDAQRSGCHS